MLRSSAGERLRFATGRMIQVWEEDGNGLAISARVDVSVSTFQGALRGCDAMDETVIRWFSDAIMNTRTCRLQNTACVLQRLGIARP